MVRVIDISKEKKEEKEDEHRLEELIKKSTGINHVRPIIPTSTYRIGDHIHLDLMRNELEVNNDIYFDRAYKLAEELEIYFERGFILKTDYPEE